MTMKAIFLAAIFVPVFCLAQNYSAALIPDSLKENADAVKRFEEFHLIIKSPGKAVLKRKYVITVLNEKGDDFAVYGNTYDKLKDLSDISGDLYDAAGKKLKSVKKKDIIDYPVQDGESFVLDDRVKRHSFNCQTYPYTVEYEDEQDFDGIYYLPFWRPMRYERFSVQQSNFIVEAPASYKIRYKQFNYNGNPVITNASSNTVYTWAVNNQKAVEFEALQPDWDEVATSVYLAASDFSIGGYNGNMDSWLGLGKFQAELNKGRDELPDNVKKDVHSLTDGVKDVHEKIKLLYTYLQSNTHYIGIQLGIGGWQPFDAKYVSTKKYGDCKALSNFMISLLKEAGVKANYVLINSGDGEKGLLIENDFPAPAFNHVIACVPNGTDTTWLECTSQTVQLGYMGTFTGDRKALLIADDGGHVVNTPVYKSEDNLQLRKVSATIDESGNLTAEVNTHFTGIQQELQHSLMNNLSKEKRDKYLNEVLSLPTYTIDKYNYTEEKKAIPTVDEYLHIIAPNYVSVAGKRIFIQPNFFNKSSTRLSSDKPRKFDIEFSYPYKDVDTIVVQIPAGYGLEAMPKSVSLSNKFGNYSISYNVTGNTINVLRTSQRPKAGRFPATDYADLVKFYDDMYKADRGKIVFVKKDS